MFFKTSHHDVIHVEFNDEDKMQRFVKAMECQEKEHSPAKNENMVN